MGWWSQVEHRGMEGRGGGLGAETLWLPTGRKFGRMTQKRPSKKKWAAGKIRSRIWAGFSQKGPKRGRIFKSFAALVFLLWKTKSFKDFFLNRILFWTICLILKKNSWKIKCYTKRPNSSLNVRKFWSVLAVLSWRDMATLQKINPVHPQLCTAQQRREA